MKKLPSEMCQHFVKNLPGNQSLTYHLYVNSLLSLVYILKEIYMKNPVKMSALSYVDCLFVTKISSTLSIYFSVLNFTWLIKLTFKA